MRLFPPTLVLLCAVFLGACASTPESRIADNSAAFAQYPPDVQQKIRAGRVEVGFTPQMVVLAVGEPARKFTTKTETGEAELWVYHDNGPRFSFGIGVGSYGSHSATAVGISSSTGGYDPEERMRVEFRNGLVTTVESIKR